MSADGVLSAATDASNNAKLGRKEVEEEEEIVLFSETLFERTVVLRPKFGIQPK